MCPISAPHHQPPGARTTHERNLPVLLQTSAFIFARNQVKMRCGAAAWRQPGPGWCVPLASCVPKQAFASCRGWQLPPDWEGMGELSTGGQELCGERTETSAVSTAALARTETCSQHRNFPKAASASSSAIYKTPVSPWHQSSGVGGGTGRAGPEHITQLSSSP